MKLTLVLRIVALLLLLGFAYLRFSHTGESYSIYLFACGVLLIIISRIIDFQARKKSMTTSEPPNQEN